MATRSGILVNLGRADYRAAWTFQEQIHHLVSGDFEDVLILVEHNPVLTLGANFHAENLLRTSAEYAELGIQVVPNDRGGDVTYHGPGQLTIYPIFNLNRHGKDLHRWLRDLEETQLSVLQHFGIQGRRFPPHTGAWVEDRKISAIGVKVKRWTSLHGIAFNVANDLAIYREIVPCGIKEFGVTNLAQELKRELKLHEAIEPTVKAFQSVFGLTFTQNFPKEVQGALDTAGLDHVSSAH